MSRLTVDEVRQLVAQIREVAAKDDERAHKYEDALFVSLLEAIASNTCEDPIACAAAAMQTRKIDFSRWCS